MILIVALVRIWLLSQALPVTGMSFPGIITATKRFARKEGLTLIVASSHDDLLADMQPDVVIIKRARGKTEIIMRTTDSEQRTTR
jgi:hypothetical protein